MIAVLAAAPEIVSPPLWTTVGFVAIVFGLCGAFVMAARRAAPEGARGRWTALALQGLTVWLAVAAGLSASGVLVSDGLVPRIMVFFAAVNGTALVLALSRFGRRVAESVSLAWLIGIQGFRLPLELILHAWWEAGTIPESMTWSGYNIDILSGVICLVAGLLLARRPNRMLAMGANLLGLVLLINVMIVATLSSPVPFRQFFDGPALALVFHPPYSWIANVCVAGALFTHVVAFRALKLERGGSGPSRSNAEGP